MNKKWVIFNLLGVLLIFILTGCGNDKGYADTKNLKLKQLQLPKEKEEIAVLYTNYGEIKIRLFDEAAPKAVENFKGLIRNGTYNNKTFYRVRKEDFIMGGDPDSSSLWGEPFEDEFDTQYRNIRGAVAMSNAGENTNGNVFYIVQRNYIEDDIAGILDELSEVDGFPKDVVKAYKKLGGLPELDFQHTVFGQVFYGLDVVDEINKVEVDELFLPREDVIIEKAEIVEFHK